MEEPVELETAPEAGARGVRVARDPRGLYVTKAPKSLRVHQGDRLVSARVFFEGASPEVVERVLESVGSCKVSFCVRRPPTDACGTPGGTSTSEEHKGKVARLSIPILTPSKKPSAAPGVASVAPTGTVAAVEFALPKLSKLVKSRGAAEPALTTAVPPAEPKRLCATPSRLTVKEVAASKPVRMEQAVVKVEVPSPAAEVPAGTGTRFPAVEVAVPNVTVGLSLAGLAPPAAPQAKESTLRLPRLEVAVPALPLPAAMPEPGANVGRPQSKDGEGDSPSSSRKGRGSPGLKTKLPDFSKAPAEDEEREAGTRRGFGGIHVPSLAISIPSAAVELVPELSPPKPEPAVAGWQPQAEVKLPARRSESQLSAPAPSTFLAPGVPSINIAVPRVAVGLALPAGVSAAAAPGEGEAKGMPDLAAKFAKGLQKLSLELEPAAPLPAVEIAAPVQLPEDVPATGARAKPPKFALPWFGLSLSKMKAGSNGNVHPSAARGTGAPVPPSLSIAGPTAALDLALGTVSATSDRVKLKVPKLSLSPFSAKDEDKGASGEEGPQGAGAGVKLPQLGIRGSRGWDDGKSVELGSPGAPRLRVPQVGITLPTAGSRRAPSLPKLPRGLELGGGVKLAKFGGSSPDIRTSGDPKILRRGGSAESLSLGLARRKMPESPSMTQLKLKTRGAMGGGGGQTLAPRFTIPTVGFSTPGKQPEDSVSWKITKPTSMAALKVPVLELAPPGRDGMEETTKKDPSLERKPGVKLPKFGPGFAESGLEREGRRRMGGVKAAVAVLVKPKEKGEAKRVVGSHPHINGDAEGKAWRRHWLPRVGFSPRREPPSTQPKMRFPTVELSPGDPKVNQGPGMTEVPPRFNLGGFGVEGTPPKFQLPKLALSPQPCGEW